MKKDPNIKEYFEKWENISLSEASRSRIQNNLREYARFHGADEAVRVGDESRFREQVPQRTSLFNLLKTKTMTAAIITLVLIAGGGTSYAAEGAVPGDFLYPVKVEVNENIKSAFALSNEAEARLQAELAKERLEEAEELASRGELSAETSAEISTRLKKHYEEAEERTSRAEASGDFESSATVRASLEGTLRTYASILADLNTQVSGNDGDGLVTDIRAYAKSSAEAQTRATATVEASVSAKSAAETAIKRAETIIAEVEVKLSRAEAKLSSETHARIEAKFDEALEAQAEAQASLRAEAYAEAYSTIQTAIRIASEVDSMIDSALRLKVDVDVSLPILRDEEPTACTMDAKQCPDGTYVGRTGPNCEFVCPPNDENTDDSGETDKERTDVEVEGSTETEIDISNDMIDTNTDINTNVRSGVSI